MKRQVPDGTSVGGIFMESGNPARDKSFKFAVRIVKFSKWMKEERKDFELASQLLRSGTSIGANVEEAQSAQSKKDFLHKNHIAFKEANETIYWLKLLKEAKIITNEQADSLLSDALELKKLLASITKTTRENLKK